MQTDVQQVAMCVLNNCFFPLFCFIQELTMQMNLLELILKLQQKETQSGVFWEMLPKEKGKKHAMARDWMLTFL